MLRRAMRGTKLCVNAVTFLGRLPAPDKLKGTDAARRIGLFSSCLSSSLFPPISPAQSLQPTAEDIRKGSPAVNGNWKSSSSEERELHQHWHAFYLGFLRTPVNIVFLLVSELTTFWLGSILLQICDFFFYKLKMCHARHFLFVRNMKWCFMKEHKTSLNLSQDLCLHNLSFISSV